MWSALLLLLLSLTSTAGLVVCGVDMLRSLLHGDNIRRLHLLFHHLIKVGNDRVAAGGRSGSGGRNVEEDEDDDDATTWLHLWHISGSRSSSGGGDIAVAEHVDMPAAVHAVHIACQRAGIVLEKEPWSMKLVLRPWAADGEGPSSPGPAAVAETSEWL